MKASRPAAFAFDGRRSLIAGVLLLSAVAPQRAENAEREALEIIHASVHALTDVMVHDIFSPPVASRGYAYPLIAFYEALRHQNPAYRSYAGQLNGLSEVPQPDTGESHDWLLAGTQAFMRVAEEMVFSQVRFRGSRDEIMLRLVDPPEDVHARSVTYGNRVADHILAWAARDGYARTRSLPRYEVASNEPGAWEPTPPAYMDAIEPHWRKLRPFALLQADQFVPERPTPFDTSDDAPFIEELVEVLQAGNTLTQEQREIAAFWDCNPFVLHQVGHLSFGLKKITPGGHWMGITEIAIRQHGDDPLQAVAAYSMVAVAVADGFITAWDEKYRSNRIRPETAIRKYLDPDWQPVLQTPPFPEYPSAHSVISMAAATVLTHVYGADFSYVDDVEETYGLEPRHFNSFMEAAKEAAISRLFGGIHYFPAIEVGMVLGRKVGEWVVERIAHTDLPTHLAPTRSVVPVPATGEVHSNRNG